MFFQIAPVTKKKIKKNFPSPGEKMSAKVEDSTVHRHRTNRKLPVSVDNGRFYTRGRIMRLDELRQTFVIRLVIRL